MKILIVSYFFPPLSSVASLRPFALADSFARSGHQVTVLTAEKRKTEAGWDKKTNGFSLIEVNSPILSWLQRRTATERSSHNPSSTPGPVTRLLERLNRWRIRRGLLVLGRMPDLFDLLIRPSVTAVQDQRWDVVISTYAPRYSHAVAMRLKQQGCARWWVADFRDLWTQHHQFKGLFPFTYLERFLEQKYLQTADLVTTVSGDLADALQENSPKRPVHIMPNGYDPEESLTLDRAPYFDGERIRLVYTGTTYPRWGSFRHFLAAVQQLNQACPGLADKIEILFAGADIANLQTRSNNMGLAGVIKFLGQVPRQDALRMQRDADIQLFFDPNEHQGIATGKLYEYISSGSYSWRIGPPINTVAIRIFEHTRTGEDIGCNPNEIAARLTNLVQNQTKPQVLPDISALTKFQRDNIARDLLSQITELR